MCSSGNYCNAATSVIPKILTSTIITISACLLSRLCGLSRLLLAGLLLLLLRLFRFVPSVFNGIDRILTLRGSGRGRHE